VDARATGETLVFEGWHFDRQARLLYRQDAIGTWTPVLIGSRAQDILTLLLEQPGTLVSKDAIMEAVWPNTAVEANNLNVQIAALRRVLDRDRSGASCIQTVSGRGYRLVAAVTRLDEAEVGSIPRTPPVVGGPTLSALVSDLGIATTQLKQPGARHRLRSALTIAATALIVTGAAVTGWWWFTGISPNVIQTAPEPAPAATASQAPRPAGAKAAMPMDVGLSNAPRLSAVVIPFNNLGGEGVDDDAVDGITEDLTTNLSRVPGFLVIARNSAFTYKGKPIDIKRVGEELCARYAVEGSVRKADGTLRVNARLVSTETGTHLWAERFDVRRDGIGYGVDDIVRDIAWALNVRIVNTEAARNLRERPSNPDVADILLRARSIYNRPPTPQRQAELVPLYERALELDPNSATALAGLAEAMLDNLGPYDDPSRPEAIRRAEELLRRAELLGPDDNAVLWVRVYLLGVRKRCSEVIPAAQRAVDAGTNLTGPRQWQGICLTWMGRSAEAITAIEQAIRFNPRTPYIGTRYRMMGYPLLFLGRYDEAVVWFERSLAATPGDSYRSDVYAAIAAAQALAGHTEQARLNASEATRLQPTITARSYYPIYPTNPVAVAQVSRMRDGMRLAGIRDHANEDADFGLPADDALHTNYRAPTPTTLPGAQIIRTPDLVKLREQRKPLVIDTINGGLSISGAAGLWGAGIGGTLSDEYQGRLSRKMQQLTGEDRTLPIVTVGFNSERYQGRNLALRLVALGYTNVYWYRGGREAWEVAGLPETELVVQEW
jgi:adenylate cyclase